MQAVRILDLALRDKNMRFLLLDGSAPPIPDFMAAAQAETKATIGVFKYLQLVYVPKIMGRKGSLRFRSYPAQLTLRF